jgi:hypothetical protein
MSAAFDDALVVNWESLEGTFGLPDPDDEDVVAAALVGGAGVIVTSNLKDFPPQTIPEPLTVVSPAQFAADTVAVSPDIAHRAVVAIASRLIRPALTVDQILEHLETRYNMVESVELIRGTIYRGFAPTRGSVPAWATVRWGLRLGRNQWHGETARMCDRCL